MKNFQDLFNSYTLDDVSFFMMNKDIVYPDDKSLNIYSKTLIPEDTPWTILSYKLYGKIDYWWLLAGINRHMFKRGDSSIFYAPAGMTCYFIKKEVLPELFNNIL